jgi:hypothetical protein
MTVTSKETRPAPPEMIDFAHHMFDTTREGMLSSSSQMWTRASDERER